MNENLKAFLDAIENDEELKEKVSEIDQKEQEKPEERMDEYIAVAKEYGLPLTEEDFAPDQPDTSEMTDEELQAVTGGEDEENVALLCGFIGKASPGDPSTCFCVVAGGGKEGCGCAVAGVSGVPLFGKKG